jgi:putative ribosome biogenesis GTPase RsgA
MENFIREFNKWYESLNEEDINKYFMDFTQVAAQFAWEECSKQYENRRCEDCACWEKDERGWCSCLGIYNITKDFYCKAWKAKTA